VGKNSHSLAHTLKSLLKHKNVHNTSIKTLEEMFLQVPYWLQVEALQSSLDISDHPETTLKPRWGLSTGKIVSDTHTALW